MLYEIEIQRLESEKASIVASLQRQSAAFNAEPASAAELPTLDQLVETAKNESILSQLAVYEGAREDREA